MMARTSLEANQRAIELAGHNLANVSNQSYARQRLRIETAPSVGGVGGGIEVAGVEQYRDGLLDRQVSKEISVLAYLESKQEILQYTESTIGQEIERQATTPEGKAASQGISGQLGLGDGLTEFFNSLQEISVLVEKRCINSHFWTVLAI